MVIIIDGYNVLKAVYKGKDVSEKERALFISSLKRYGRRLKHKVVLVFDGGDYEWAFKERADGVYVVYSGYNETADDYIKRYLKDHKNSDLLLVSSDHELNECASRHKLPSIGGFHFYQLMEEELQKSPTHRLEKSHEVRKITEDVQPEIDELMEQASKVVPLKSEDFLIQPKTRLSSSKKSSKLDRKLLKKLKKL